MLYHPPDMKKYFLVSICALSTVSLFGAGCGSTSSTAITPSVNTTETAPSAVAPSAPAPVAKTGPDACALVTTDLIKQTLGFDVSTGIAKSSGTGGSACAFKSADGKMTMMMSVQLTADGKMYYQDESLFKAAVQLGIGDKGVFQGPDSGNTTVEMMKNGTLAYVTIYSKNAYTAAQVKAFMTAIAGKL